MTGRTYSSFLSSDKESYESLSTDEEVPMKSSGSQSWGLKGIPCNWRFFQNDWLQLLCRALQGWVTRAIWDCLLEEFRRVKATCVLYNFMRMDMRNRMGSAARRCVPEEKVWCSAGCVKDGVQQHSKRGNLCYQLCR